MAGSLGSFAAGMQGEAVEAWAIEAAPAAHTETHRLVAAEAPGTGGSCARPRCGRRLVLAAALVAALVAVLLLAAAAGNEGTGTARWGCAEGSPISLAAAEPIAEEAAPASATAGERRADAIEALLRDKPRDEASTLVRKAMEKASSDTFAKRRQLEQDPLREAQNLTEVLKILAAAKSLSKEPPDAEAQRKAECAFEVIFTVQFLARAAFNIQAAAKVCPDSKGLVNKICAVDALLAVSVLTRAAGTLSVAASTCAETVNTRALCASSVTGLVSALSQLAAAGTIVGKVCSPTGQAEIAAGLPQGATVSNIGGPTFLGPQPAPTRRLFFGGGKSNIMAQCVLDATHVAWSLGTVGLALNAAVKETCPPKGAGTPLYGLSQSACAIDVGGVIFGFSRIATFLSAAFIHCTNAFDMKAVCSTAVSAVISAAAGLEVVGNGFYSACDMGLKLEALQASVPMGLATGVEEALGASRRLGGLVRDYADPSELTQRFLYNISDPRRLPVFDSVEDSLKVLESLKEFQAERLGIGEEALARRFGSVEEIWQHLGFNLSDPEAAPGVDSPSLRAQGERFVHLVEAVLDQEDLQRVERASGAGGTPAVPAALPRSSAWLQRLWRLGGRCA